MRTESEKAEAKKGCAGCAGCPLGRLIAEGKLGANVDPVRFQAAIAHRRLAGGCAPSSERPLDAYRSAIRQP